MRSDCLAAWRTRDAAGNDSWLCQLILVCGSQVRNWRTDLHNRPGRGTRPDAIWHAGGKWGHFCTRRNSICAVRSCAKSAGSPQRRPRV